jgi:hypothetical protein
VENQVGRGLPQIVEDCFERNPIAVDVGHDCDTHPGSGVKPSKNVRDAEFST